MEIDIGVYITALNEPAVMPGISIDHGAIAIDPKKLTYPGDVLHEAGHITAALPERRAAMTGILSEGSDYLGDEIASQIWSYAACVHLGLDPRIVFHNGGYHESSEMLINAFSSEQPVGVPLL